MAEEFKYALVIPEKLVNQYTRVLMKRRGKNMPQTITTRFDGDEKDTRLWLDEKEGCFTLMSQYEGRDFVQEVMTPAEMFEKQELKPVTLKGKLLDLFRSLGCSIDDAYDNTMNFLAAHHLSDDIQRANLGTKKLLALFKLMKDENVRPEVLEVRPDGSLILGISPNDGEKVKSIRERLDLSEYRRPEEECEDNPRNEY